ncbi:MAG: hypothetical protein QM768_03320 [Agriterribacter sp.]
MVRFCLMSICLFVFSLNASFAQTDSAVAKPWKTPFKTKYTRVGVNMLGNNLDALLSSKDNIMNGNLGAGIGFVLETGHVFYFLKRTRERKVNAGLDWTIISLSYNPVKKNWKNYAEAVGKPDADIAGILPFGGGGTTPFIGSIASRLGPVVAINPVQKLVIELRAQVSAGAYTYLMGYNEDARGFVTFDDREDAKVKYFLICIKPGFGCTIRWGRLGLAFDYSPGKTNMDYSETDANGNETHGTMKVPFNTMQFKLNF